MTSYPLRWSPPAIGSGDRSADPGRQPSQVTAKPKTAVGRGSPAPELHLTRLLRAAEGDRPAEAAILLLGATGLVDRLVAGIVVDVEGNLAWIDWDAVTDLAARMSVRNRAVVRTACALDNDIRVVLDEDRPALTAAFDHLLL